MTKPIKHYPQHMTDEVISRRLKQAKMKGLNGLGVLSALDAQEKRKSKK